MQLLKVKKKKRFVSIGKKRNVELGLSYKIWKLKFEKKMVIIQVNKPQFDKARRGNCKQGKNFKWVFAG